MVKYCSIRNCKNEWNPQSQISFHSFPAENEERTKKWMENIPKDLLFNITKYTIICSEHFENKYYEMGCIFRKKLKKDAVPIIFKSSSEKEKNNSSHKSQLIDSNQLNTNFFEDVTCHTSIHNNVSYSEVRNKVNIETQVEDRYFCESPRIKQLKRNIKVLKQRLKRREKALTSMKLLVSQLKAKVPCNTYKNV